MKQKTLGIIFILLASIMWAFETVVAKLAYRTSDFSHTVAIRTISVAIIAVKVPIVIIRIFTRSMSSQKGQVLSKTNTPTCTLNEP